jgi:RNA polymerase sigma-70 factor (ECF subfamily)
LQVALPSQAQSRPVDPDIGLVERFLAGERGAFDQLVRRYQQPIYYLALRYLGSEADAKDAVQQTFVKVFRSLSSFRGASSFRTWLYRIAINLCLNHIRDHKRERPTEIADDQLTTTATGPQRLIRDEASAALRAAIDNLPPKQRMVLELRIYDELRFKEIAELADCTENAAKVNFHHAVKRLRGVLGNENDENGSRGVNR